MKRKVSFKLFFTVLWRGVCQMVRFVGKMLGYKGQDSYAKVIWRIFVGCGALLMVMFTSVMLYFFVSEFVLDEWARKLKNSKRTVITEEVHISNNVVFQRVGNGDKTRLYNEKTQEVLLQGLDWVVVSDDKDSLAVFSKDNRRGYVNRFTGETVIQPVYTKAWVFCEGLAAVEHNGKLKFINHKGEIVIDNNLEVHFNDPSYGFRNGYCLIRDKVNSKFGFIDTSGNWVIEPVYDNVDQYDGFVKVITDYKEGLYSATLEELLPAEYMDINIDFDDETIMARKKDDTAVLYDFEMNVLEDFVIAEVSKLEYDTKVERYTNEDGEEVCEKVYATANCYAYKVGAHYYSGHYGLISKEGIRLTPPIYYSIEAIGPDRYLCLPHGVILNDAGEAVE